MSCEPCKKSRSNLPNSISSTVQNIAKSVRNGEQLATPHQVKQQRLATCEQCDSVKRYHNIKGATIGMLDLCTEKGYLIVAATRIKSETCPLNLWSE